MDSPYAPRGLHAELEARLERLLTERRPIRRSRRTQRPR